MKVFICAFCILELCLAKSVLERACENLPKSFYYGHSCLVESNDTEKLKHAACNDLNEGHLVFLLTNKMKMAVYDKMSEGVFNASTYKWIGLEQINTTVEPDQGWAWVHPDGRNWIVPAKEMILWASGQPDNNKDQTNAMYGVLANDNKQEGILDGVVSNNRYYICQYEEPKTRRFYNYMNNKKGHNSTVIKEINNIGQNDCARSSRMELVASSFAYNQNTRHCIVQWTDGRLAGYEPVDAPGYEFWHLDY